jgi:hypothetical protein
LTPKAPEPIKKAAPSLQIRHGCLAILPRFRLKTVQRRLTAQPPKRGTDKTIAGWPKV